MHVYLWKAAIVPEPDLGNYINVVPIPFVTIPSPFSIFANMTDKPAWSDKPAWADKPAWSDKPSWTVKPWIEKISDQLTMQVRSSFFCHAFSVPIITRAYLIHKVAVQDLIDTPLDEALAKLDARVTENKIALAVQEMELHNGRLSLEQHLKGVAAWNRYKAEYIAKQLRDREEMLLRKRASKRARTQACYL